MEQFAEFLIQYIHAPLGGIALLSGGISSASSKTKLEVKCKGVECSAKDERSIWVLIASVSNK